MARLTAWTWSVGSVLMAPQRTLRPRSLFVVRLPGYRYYSVDPINRSMEELNQCPDNIDIFIDSLTAFRTLVLRKPAFP